jgi:phosphatidylserine/phosphatidylglycerophosphate/cardiolipin synthase-like enzyme
MARLHAKVTVVDDSQLVVGRIKLDSRSAIGNTELSLALVNPPALAEVLRLGAEKLQPALTYRLRLQSGGETIDRPGIEEQDHLRASRDVPGSTPWLRQQLWLQSLPVGDGLL